MMNVALRKYGNSTVIVLPPMVLKELGLSTGSMMSLTVNPDKSITLKSARCKLDDLISACNFALASPADITPWEMSSKCHASS